MDNCLPVISIGRRCVKYGYEFHWKPYSSAPVLIKPNGEKISLFVENFIPYVPNPDYDHSPKTKASTAAPATASVMPKNVGPGCTAKEILRDDVESPDEDDLPDLTDTSSEEERDTTQEPDPRIHQRRGPLEPRQ